MIVNIKSYVCKKIKFLNNINMRKVSPILAMIAVLIWGVSFTAGKIGYTQFSIFELLYLRMGFATLLFIPIILYSIYKKNIPSKNDFIYLAIAGILSFPVTLGLQFSGLMFTEASVASIVVGLEGFATMIMAFLVLKQKPRKSNIFIATVAFIGIFITIGKPDEARLIGVLLIFCASLFAGLSIVVKKKLVDRMSPVNIVAWSVLFGTLPIIIFSPMFGGAPDISNVTAEVWVSIIVLSFGATFIAYILFAVCLKHISATRSAQFIVIEPVVGVLAGVWLLSEPLTLNIVLGATIVGGAILLNSLINDGN